MALFAILAAEHLEQKVDLGHVLEMIIVHDLVEAISGDVPFTEESDRKRNKREIEAAAIKDIAARIGEPVGSRIERIWNEFENSSTAEAKFSRALDNLEVQVQHNIANLNTWEPKEFGLVYTKMDRHCAHDAFLLQLCDEVKADAERRMREFGVDPATVRKSVGMN